MDLYAVRSPFLPVIKEACKLRGVVASSTGTFPMPNATVEDDAKILELLRREGIPVLGESRMGELLTEGEACLVKITRDPAKKL